MTTDLGNPSSGRGADPVSLRVEEREPDEILLALTSIWATIRRNWLVAALVFILTLGCVAAVGLSMTPLWRVEIVVIPVRENDPSALSGLASSFGLFGRSAFGGADVRSEESLAVLRSRELINEYVRENELLPVLFDDQWDAEQGEWTVPPDSVPTLRQAYALFDGSIREIEQDRLTGTVTLSITWKDREQAAVWAREIIALANRQIRERAAAEAMINIEYLNDEMRTATGLGAQNALSVALANAYEQQLQNYMFARGQQEYAFRVIDPPTVPDEWERVSPQRSVVALVGVLLAAVFAIGAAFIANLISGHAPKQSES